MIKSFYEEPIFSSDFQRKDLQVIDKSIQQLLDKNNGVGVVGGFYTPGLPVGIISELALRSLGCHRDEVFGSGYTMQFADCFAEDCDLRDLENFRQFKGKRTLCLHTRDGGWRWFYLCKDEKQLPDGRVMWLLTLCDCNALHKREKWLVEARNSAEAANRAKSSFLSRMSHDIRSPLNGILGMAKIAYDNAENPEKVRDTMEKLTAAGQQLETLINDVLDISRMESGRMRITHEPFDLYELLARCGDTLHTQVVRMQLTCHVHFNHRHSHVIGSPLHVQRIIANISSNAVKYNRVGGTINYTLDEIPKDENHAVYRFTVQDTGIGMSEEFQQRMFEPFTQENAGARSVYGGTGLGMSITKSLVDKMGGTIGVESKQGVGTTYTITLPFAIDNTATEEPERQQTDLTVLRGRQVLLAEDNALNMEIIEFLLNDVGIKVTKAADGQQAVEAFAASPVGGFDAILMDVMMPVRDGHEATRAIRAMDRPDAKSIPIFAMTANAFAEDRLKALQAGMNEHLSKPIDPDTLYRLLVKYLTERS